jgi:hypothetical protein
MTKTHSFARSRRRYKVVHLFTCVFVFGYIAFDVLDLDLSDFLLKVAPGNRVAMAAEVPSGVEETDVLNPPTTKPVALIADIAVFRGGVRFEQNAQALTSFRFRSLRVPVRRIAHPRHSDSPSSSSSPA